MRDDADAWCGTHDTSWVDSCVELGDPSVEGVDLVAKAERQAGLSGDVSSQLFEVELITPQNDGGGGSVEDLAGPLGGPRPAAGAVQELAETTMPEAARVCGLA